MRRPRTNERVAHRDDQLGLGEGIAVVAVERVERHTLGLLAREPGPGLLGVGVRLERERPAGGEQLQQERKASALARELGTERRGGVGRHELGEVGGADGCRVDQLRGRSRVRPEPQFGLGAAARSHASELRDRRVGSPRIVPGMVADGDKHA